MIFVVNKKTHTSQKNDVYIGRGSPLGNIYDFKHSNHPQVKHIVKNREEAIEKYADYIKNKINKDDAEITNELAHILHVQEKYKNVNLVCYCAPEKCHGDILKQLLEQI